MHQAAALHLPTQSTIPLPHVLLRVKIWRSRLIKELDGHHGTPALGISWDSHIQRSITVCTTREFSSAWFMLSKSRNIFVQQTEIFSSKVVCEPQQFDHIADPWDWSSATRRSIPVLGRVPGLDGGFESLVTVSKIRTGTRSDFWNWF
jgi:hypothetical protein